jgi:hypothetical protein
MDQVRPVVTPVMFILMSLAMFILVRVMFILMSSTMFILVSLGL